MTTGITSETVKERLTNKKVVPDQETVNRFLGRKGVSRLSLFEKMLRKNYDLSRELKFPFGTNYGWAYRYTHKKALLLHVFFEKNGFCCTVSINDCGAGVVAEIINSMLPKTQELWANRYPCGKEGGWIHYSVTKDEELQDIIQLAGCKIKPKKIKTVEQ